MLAHVGNSIRKSLMGPGREVGNLLGVERLEISWGLRGWKSHTNIGWNLLWVK